MGHTPHEWTYFADGAQVAGGCLYLAPPTEYHRYGYRGYRRPADHVSARPEKWQAQGFVTCVAAADYSGGETVQCRVDLWEGNGANGNGAATKTGSFAVCEYDTGGGVTPGNIAIDISLATTAQEVAIATANALAQAVGGYVMGAGVDPNNDDRAIVMTRGPKARIGWVAVGLPVGAGTGASLTSADDISCPAASPRPCMQQYTRAAGGPGPYARTGLGQPSLFTTFNP